MERSTDKEVREKMVSYGVKSLSDAELLSIVIQKGAPGVSAVELAERLLDSHGGSLSQMSRADIARLRMSEGIGMTKAAMLSAVFELAERINERDPSLAPMVIRTQEDVVSVFEPIMSGLAHEEMWVLYLTSANGVIEKRRISQGGVAKLLVDHKLVIKRAIELLASSIVLAHNHPSGIMTPSAEDIELTNRIAEAAVLFDIFLVDHVIITGNGSYSFRSNLLLK